MTINRKGFEFNTKKELEKYLEAHPDADPKNHWVKEEKTKPQTHKPESDNYDLFSETLPSKQEQAKNIVKALKNHSKYHKDVSKVKTKLLNDIKTSIESNSEKPWLNIPETPEEEEAWRKYRENRDNFFYGTGIVDKALLWSKGDPLAFDLQYLGNPLLSWNPIGTKIKNLGDVAAIFLPLRNPLFESLKIVALNEKKQIVDFDINSIGYLSGASLDKQKLSDFATRATALGATSILISHNHPSANSQPSEPDKYLTNWIENFIKPMGLDVLDHVVTNGSVTSIKRSIIQEAQQDAVWGNPKNLETGINNAERASELLAKIKDQDNCVYAMYLNTKNRVVGLSKIVGSIEEQRERFKEIKDKMKSIGAGACIFAAPQQASTDTMGVIPVFKACSEYKINALDILSLETLKSSGFSNDVEDDNPLDVSALEQSVPYQRTRLPIIKMKNGSGVPIDKYSAAKIVQFRDKFITKTKSLTEDERMDLVRDNIGIFKKAILNSFNQQDFKTQADYFKTVKEMAELPLKQVLNLWENLTR